MLGTLAFLAACLAMYPQASDRHGERPVDGSIDLYIGRILYEVCIFHDLCLHFSFSGCCSFLTNEPVNVDNAFLIFFRQFFVLTDPAYF